LGLNISEIKEVRARIIPKESVLLTCVGDLGLISIANGDMVINQQLHSFQCSDTLNNVFLMFCLSFQKSYMYKMATSTTVPYMNKSTCNSIPIIFPPFSLQQQFAEIVNKTEALKEKQKQSEQELENLFQSLMQKAFKGELEIR
jgi:type I restriction enzyme S subunit